MNKLIPLFVIIGLLSNLTLVESSGIYNTSSGNIYTDTTNMKLTLVSQDPYPAEPNSYVDLLFKIENMGTKDAQNVKIELVPAYPFSLDPGVNPVQELGTVGGLDYGNNAFFVKYKVKVDKDAVDAVSQIRLKYSYGSNEGYLTQDFDVKVSNPKTEFDLVAQDSTQTSTILAIANIGANAAYSVIVSVPKQEGIIMSGSSASIIGNLNAGDYTLVSFQLNQPSSNTTARRTGSPTGSFANFTMNRERNLTVDISYTDLLGIRRTVEKQVPLTMTTTTTNTRAQGSYLDVSGSNGITYIVIGLVGIGAVVAFLKFRKRNKK